ncbi:MAG TPA: hypothetical protein VFA32_25695 [Dehalococcoidia bacterium]|nr:hypothetical protein [Dehalococcoidia bacterium]
MVKSRGCTTLKENGQPCGAPKLKEKEFCLMHSPEHAAEVAEGRRLGGLRRRREVAVVGAYDLEGLETVAGIRRLLEIAVVDTLGLENSVARSRTLTYQVMVAAKLLETGDLEQRIAFLESAVNSQKTPAASVFDAEPGDELFSEAEP